MTSTPPRVTAAAYTNHLSCWRSTPRERRNRTIRASTHATPQSSISGNPIATSAATTGASSVAGSSRAGPRSGQAVTATGPQMMAIGTADSQASGRQRGDGGRPSGNSSRA
jgi:hypothetical protein